MPRYTSYLTVLHFTEAANTATHAHWLAEIPGDEPLFLYVHIPVSKALRSLRLI